MAKYTTIENVVKGDYFKLMVKKKIKSGKDFYFEMQEQPTVYIADGYNRSTKKYSGYRFEDINHFIEKKKGTPVVVGFDF